jgi:threonine/homoserine/homoserine lactone efflux protein
MTFESGLSFLLAIFIFSITPGPGVFAILARALISGARACWMLALGMAVSDILYLIAACFGLAAIASNWSQAFTVVRLLGALYLIYLGWRMWHAPLRLDEPNATPDNAGAGRTAGFLQGFLISASNPKVILFYIAFLPSFMDLTQLAGTDILLVSLLTLAGLMLGLMLIALMAAKARGWFRSESALRTLNRSAGSIMVGAAAYLVSRS